MAKIKHGNTGEVTRKIGRSMYAVDVMWRIWDSYNNVWISQSSRTIWASNKAATRVMDGLIAKGRDPATLAVKRVFVEVQVPSV